MEYLGDLLTKINETIEDIRRIILESNQRTKIRYNRLTNPKEFKVGDWIWVKKEVMQMTKHTL